MKAMNRRGFLRSMVGGGAVVTIATTAGVTLLPSATEAATVPADKNLPKVMEDFVDNAQWYGHRRRVYRRYQRRSRRYYRRWHRRRRWHCWWYRGRRVCGW